MGKGSNASKIARARAEAQKKADSEKSGGGGAKGMAERKGALPLACAICKVGFMANQAKAQLLAHLDSKHPKNTFAECFPTYEEKDA